MILRALPELMYKEVRRFSGILMGYEDPSNGSESAIRLLPTERGGP